MMLGLFFGGLHALWALMVYTGFAQVYVNWIFGLHFLSNPFWIQPFKIETALTLVAFTFVVGYVAGFILGLLKKFGCRA